MHGEAKVLVALEHLRRPVQPGTQPPRHRAPGGVSSRLFQCKRYSGAVSSEVARSFRGAIEGRSEKGFITMGSFSRVVRLEATRDGARPIELVDGEKLIEMFEQLELGLTPVKTYEVDRCFFEAFV